MKYPKSPRINANKIDHEIKEYEEEYYEKASKVAKKDMSPKVKSTSLWTVHGKGNY